MTKIKADAKQTTRLVPKRSLSRLVAVQTLYQYQYNNRQDDLLDIMEDVVDNYKVDASKPEIKSYRKKVDTVFLRNLVSGITLVFDKIDKKIADSLDKKHNFDNLNDVMLAILRLGAFELQFMKDNPYKVIISEYVDIASSFHEEKKVNFINGVLDKIAQENK